MKKNEETSKFIKGKRSLDEFGDFVKQLNKLGLEEMVKIQQGAYDNFKSK